MRIVYVIAPGGGPDAYVRTLLPWLMGRDHRVSLVLTAPAPIAFPTRMQLAPPTTAHYYLSRFARNFHAWPRRLRAWETARAVEQAIHRLDSEQAVDVVEVMEGLPITRLRLQWAIVVRAHGSDWSFRHFCGEDQADDAYLIRAEAAQLRQAHAVSALSTHLAAHLSEFCHIPRERIAVMPYPIDAAQFCPASLSLSERGLGVRLLPSS